MALKQGIFKPTNRSKYKGNNLDRISYRSGWELKLMVHFDKNPNILEWSSESIAIPYFSPVDNKWHRYFPDFWVKMKKRDGKIETFIYEVKPYNQTIMPVKKKQKTKTYIQEVYTWGVNSAKWQAAMEYCDKIGCQFEILTEKDLY